MERRVIRDVRTVTVGTSSTLLVPERNGRVLTFIGGPPGLATSSVYQTARNNAVNLATAAAKLTYTVPAGFNARLTMASYFTAASTAVMQLKVTLNTLSVVIFQSTASFLVNPNVFLQAGDAVNLTVATAGGAGETGDVVIGVETYSSGPRVSLGFGAPAVLDQGLTIYGGQLPLVLPGPVLDTDVFAIADAAGRQVNLIDTFYA